MYIEVNEFPELWNVAKACGYNGRKLEVKAFKESELLSYWSGGSRTYFTFYNLVSEERVEIVQNGTAFDGQRYSINDLPDNIVMVETKIFRGKLSGCTIHVRQDQISPMLPDKQISISDNERLVLQYTRSYKSSYAGIKNFRFYQANRDNGITLESWNTAKQSLIDKKLLNKRGAITSKGKNALIQV